MALHRLVSESLFTFRSSWNFLNLVSQRGLATSAQLTAIKGLREKTGAPISDVKAALTETDYDVEKAFEALRKKGLAVASKKGSRHAAEGLLGIIKGETGVGILEINCETDFVARNENFCKLVHESSKALLNVDKSAIGDGYRIDQDALEGLIVGSSGQRLKDHVAELAGSMRENIKVRRGFFLTSPGEIFSYVHNSPPGGFQGLGKIGGLLSLESQSGPLSDTLLQTLNADNIGNKLAMHVVGLKPKYMDKDAVDGSHLAKEKEILREQALTSGKPEKIVEKIVAGRLGKFYEENCLMQQKFVMDEDVTVRKLLDNFQKKVGVKEGLKVGGFLRIECGEGLEADGEKDFAQEVAEAAGIGG